VKEIFHGAIIGFTFGFFSFITATGYAQQIFRDTNYVYSIPKQLNDGIAVDSFTRNNKEKIVDLTKKILSNEFPNIHSMLIVRNNKLIYENYFDGTDEIRGRKLGYVEQNINSLHDCRSISKSITSTCIAIAIKQKLIKSIDEPIVKYFPEYEQYFDSTKRKITIKHLLTMTAGFEWDENISYRNLKNSELQMILSNDPIKYVLTRPIISEPGIKWNYCGGQSELLGQIIQKVSTLTLAKFAEKYLFTPLGISEYQWLTLKKDMPSAASGLRLRSRDLLKIGLLYLDDGQWHSNQIIEKEWTLISLSSVVKMENDKGYGFQFYTSTHTINGRNIFISEAAGNGGQRIFFCKELNLIVVITAGNYDVRGIENNSKKALVDFIIPSFTK
jgi:CubicO group peptidase (beta-lactamase class C family)